MKPIYIAAYHQSKFGKLFDMTVPDIIAAAVKHRVDKQPAEEPEENPLVRKIIR